MIRDHRRLRALARCALLLTSSLGTNRAHAAEPAPPPPAPSPSEDAATVGTPEGPSTPPATSDAGAQASFVATTTVATTPVAPPAPSVSEPVVVSPARPPSGPPAATWILGGVGVAGLATFTALSLAGWQQQSLLERDCYGACDASRVEAVKRKFVAADVALGIGALSFGIATLLLLTSTPKDGAKKHGVEALTSIRPPPVHIDVSIKPGGGTAGISGIF